MARRFTAFQAWGGMMMNFQTFFLKKKGMKNIAPWSRIIFSPLWIHPWRTECGKEKSLTENDRRSGQSHAAFYDPQGAIFSCAETRGMRQLPLITIVLHCITLSPVDPRGVAT